MVLRNETYRILARCVAEHMADRMGNPSRSGGAGEGARPYGRPMSGLRVLLAVEGGSCTSTAVQRTLELVDDRTGCLTVAGVTRPPQRVVMFAPLTGIDPRGEIHELELAATAGAARSVAKMFPDDLPVDHCAFSSWRDLIAVIHGRAIDLVAVAAAPTRRSDRRRLTQGLRPHALRFL